MPAGIHFAGTAKAITVKPGHGIGTAAGEFFAENVERHRVKVRGKLLKGFRLVLWCMDVVRGVVRGDTHHGFALYLRVVPEDTHHGFALYLRVVRGHTHHGRTTASALMSSTQTHAMVRAFTNHFPNPPTWFVPSRTIPKPKKIIILLSLFVKFVTFN